jgi:hypothetical protein
MTDIMRRYIIPRSRAKKKSVMTMLMEGKSRKEIMRETGASMEYIRHQDSTTFPIGVNEHKHKMEIWRRAVEGARRAREALK